MQIQTAKGLELGWYKAWQLILSTQWSSLRTSSLKGKSKYPLLVKEALRVRLKVGWRQGHPNNIQGPELKINF